jgi:hypothetical protein
MEDGEWKMGNGDKGGKGGKGDKGDSAQKTRGKSAGPIFSPFTFHLSPFTFHLSPFTLFTSHVSRLTFLTSSPLPLSYIPSLSPESGLR